MKNSVYIAASLDGYIADKEGGIDWLQSIPNPENVDMGYGAFIEKIDAIVMGRKTFETVCGFNIDWPYNRPVFVLSNTMKEIKEAYREKADLVKGNLTEVLERIHLRGHVHLYIDGGTTVQSFLKEDLIDEMIITTFPLLLGGGHSLFSELDTEFQFELITSDVLIGSLVQSHYKRKREI